MVLCAHTAHLDKKGYAQEAERGELPACKVGGISLAARQSGRLTAQSRMNRKSLNSH